MTINNYYEIVIMPVGPGLINSGFANAVDPIFKIIALPNSC
jgi:hypothetical protein